jgi:hypothetical protein
MATYVNIGRSNLVPATTFRLPLGTEVFSARAGEMD